MTASPCFFKNNLELKKQNTFGKVVREPLYILCKCDKKNIEKLKINNTYEVKINSFSKNVIDCKIVKIVSNHDESEFVIILQAKNIPKSVLNLRGVDIKIVVNKYFGAKINKKYIVKTKFNVNDEEFSDVVYVKHLKNFIKKKVEIIAENDDFAICKYVDTPEIDVTKIQDGDQVLKPLT